MFGQTKHSNEYRMLENKSIYEKTWNAEKINRVLIGLTFSWRRPLSYRNQSIDLDRK